MDAKNNEEKEVANISSRVTIPVAFDKEAKAASIALGVPKSLVLGQAARFGLPLYVKANTVKKEAA